MDKRRDASTHLKILVQTSSVRFYEARIIHLRTNYQTINHHHTLRNHHRYSQATALPFSTGPNLLRGDGERVLVFVVEILFQIEEGVEEDVDQFDLPLQVDQRHEVRVRRMNQIQHLTQEILERQRLDAHGLQSAGKKGRLYMKQKR